MRCDHHICHSIMRCYVVNRIGRGKLSVMRLTCIHLICHVMIYSSFTIGVIHIYRINTFAIVIIACYGH